MKKVETSEYSSNDRIAEWDKKRDITQFKGIFRIHDLFCKEFDRPEFETPPVEKAILKQLIRFYAVFFVAWCKNVGSI